MSRRAIHNDIGGYGLSTAFELAANRVALPLSLSLRDSSHEEVRLIVDLKGVNRSHITEVQLGERPKPLSSYLLHQTYWEEERTALPGDLVKLGNVYVFGKAEGSGPNPFLDYVLIDAENGVIATSRVLAVFNYKGGTTMRREAYNLATLEGSYGHSSVTEDEQGDPKVVITGPCLDTTHTIKVTMDGVLYYTTTTPANFSESEHSSTEQYIPLNEYEWAKGIVSAIPMFAMEMYTAMHMLKGRSTGAHEKEAKEES